MLVTASLQPFSLGCLPSLESEGESPGKRPEVNAPDAPLRQRQSRSPGRSPRGQNVIHQNNVMASNPGAKPSRELKRSFHICSTLPRSQANLAAARGPDEKLLDRKPPQPGQDPGQDRCLVVAANPSPLGRGWNGDQYRIAPSGGPLPCHLLSHKLRHVPPSSVLQRVDHGTGSGIQNDGGPCRDQDRRPLAALQTELPGRLARASGSLASRAKWRSRRFQAHPADRADQGIGPLRGNPGPAGQTPPGKEEVQEVPGRHSRCHRPPASSRALDMTSREGSTPHQRWKATAAW